MNRSHNIELIKHELMANSSILTRTADRNFFLHKKRVRRGKLLLKLLSSIGHSPVFFKWLGSAVSNGNFYEFRRYKIVKKNTSVKDVIDIKDLPSIRENAIKFLGIDSKDNNLLSIMGNFNLLNEGYSSDKVWMSTRNGRILSI